MNLVWTKMVKKKVSDVLGNVSCWFRMPQRSYHLHHHIVDCLGSTYHVCFSASLHEPGYQDELRNFSPVSEMRKGQRSWGRVLASNLRTKQTWQNTKILTFGPIIASVTLKAVSL